MTLVISQLKVANISVIMGIYSVFDFNKLEYFNLVKAMGKKGYYILKFFFQNYEVVWSEILPAM